MKALTRFLTTLAILCVGINFGSHVVGATEMDVDVGIEFTEIEPEPKLPDTSGPSQPTKPTPTPPTKPTPPRLPQTGETLGKSSMVTGGFIVLGTSLLLWRRRREVNH